MAKITFAVNLLEAIREQVVSQINGDTLSSNCPGLDEGDPDLEITTVSELGNIEIEVNKHNRILVEIEVLYDGDDEEISEAVREFVMDHTPAPEFDQAKYNEDQRVYGEIFDRVLDSNQIHRSQYNNLMNEVQTFIHSIAEKEFEDLKGYKYEN